MEELVEKMKVVLGSTFVAGLKAHGYHWNVIGSDFPQLHDFFAEIYGEYEGSIDDIAEQIRQLDSFSPGTVARMLELSTINEDEKIPTAEKMIANLLTCNEAILSVTTEAYNMAEEQKAFGLSNYLQDRITALTKLNWKIKATLGKKS
mgnify:FL=1